MATFDFVSGDDFRKSLEDDYRELQSAMETKSWKSAHVLAGSIIEAILVDYLVAIKYKAKGGKDLLKMDLNELITACREEGILSERAADLSTVVRGYRNLIHPGRVVRLQETVDENGATVARSLVEMIVGEVARRREQNFGYTAEQLTTKITQDSSTVTIIGHLLKDMHPHELGRLLTAVLPTPYMKYTLPYKMRPDPALDALPSCFRAALNHVTDDIKTKVSRNFVRILKEESEAYIHVYEAAFFRCTDLVYLQEEEVRLVVGHLLRRITSGWGLGGDAFVDMIEGIGQFIHDGEMYRDEAYEFFNAISSFASCELIEDEEELPGYVLYIVGMEVEQFSERARENFNHYLAARIDRFGDSGQEREADMLKKLQAQLAPASGASEAPTDISPDDISF